MRLLCKEVVLKIFPGINCLLMCECSWIICSISLGKIERVLFISFDSADSFQICISDLMNNVINVLKRISKNQNQFGAYSHIFLFGGGGKESLALNFTVLLYSPHSVHVLLPDFCGVFMSFACCDLLLITRCSCISKSTFLSLERGQHRL